MAYEDGSKPESEWVEFASTHTDNCGCVECEYPDLYYPY